jgi:hypothetical protein
LELWKGEINQFLDETLKIKLHPQKSRIILLSKGVDFVGFRNFYHHKLLRKRNVRSMEKKVDLFQNGILTFTSVVESYQGWQAYASWANSHKLRNRVKRSIVDVVWDKI